MIVNLFYFRTYQISNLPYVSLFLAVRANHTTLTLYVLERKQRTNNDGTILHVGSFRVLYKTLNSFKTTRCFIKQGHQGIQSEYDGLLYATKVRVHTTILMQQITIQWKAVVFEPYLAKSRCKSPVQKT